MSLAPPVTVNVSNATGSGRTKVALTPGHSLMDWVRLCGDKSKDLTGVGGPGTYGPVSEEDLEQKNSEDNAWITIKGHCLSGDQIMRLPGNFRCLRRCSVRLDTWSLSLIFDFHENGWFLVYYTCMWRE